MNLIERVMRCERRFGRLHAYRRVLSWAAFSLSTAASLLIFTPMPSWVSLALYALACAGHAGWELLSLESTRQIGLIMADAWDELDRLIEP